MEKYEITGMSCAACVARVEKAVNGVSGVEKCSVNLLTNSMLVEGNAGENEIISAVKDAGYGAVKIDENGQINDTSARFSDNESPRLRRRLLLSAGFLAVLMYISMGHVMWGWYLPDFMAKSPVLITAIQMALSFTVMIINGRFFVNGIRAVLKLSPNMDTLVALGSGVSFAYSVYIFIIMMLSENKAHYLHELYFESAAMIVTLITVGKLLEAMAKGKTTSALKSLMDLTPRVATVIRDGKELTVRASELVKGDIFLVRNGESVPADGVILEGEASLDESSLTGESVPVDKKSGDLVSASTINSSGFIKCRAERTGNETAIAQIIKTVSDATATKAPIAKIADKVSGFFVPSIILIALIVTAIWLIVGDDAGYAIGRGISVLVISCPCALGLATPVAIMVGSGVGAKNGVLFKTAQALEETGRAKIVALDKTGTVTSGEMNVKEVIPCEGFTAQELLSLACSVEEKSEHPLARAIVKRSAELGLKHHSTEEFKALTGSGVWARANDDEIVGGRADFISKYAHIPEDFLKIAQEKALGGATPLFFAKGKKLAGIITVSDTVKETSKEAVEWLKSNGIRVVMLTGDNEYTARAIANEVGIDEVIAGVYPEEKGNAIMELKTQGKTVMVGDGVNDAPALAVADVGIAIGAGTDVAIDTAEVVVMKNELADVCTAISLSRKTLGNIRQNLFWAFFYNVIAIPIAAGAFASLGFTLSPMLGALAMSLSSFCVVTNALRLNFFKPVRKKGVDNAENIEEINEYKENEMVTVLKVSGMMCPHCEARVKKALEAIDGVKEAKPNHKKGIVKITFDSGVDIDVLKATVSAEGYKVE